MPLDGLDSHIVVHFLSHVGTLCKDFGLIRQMEGVELDDAS